METQLVADGLFHRLEGVYPPLYWHECAPGEGCVWQALIYEPRQLMDRGISVLAKLSCHRCGRGIQESVIYPTLPGIQGELKDG